MKLLADPVEGKVRPAEKKRDASVVRTGEAKGESTLLAQSPLL